MGSLLNDVDVLILKRVGDKPRLENIKKTIENDEQISDEDRKYLDELVERHLFSNLQKNEKEIPKIQELKEEPINNVEEQVEIEKSFCGNCGNKLAGENFCSKCDHALNSNLLESKPKVVEEKAEVVEEKAEEVSSKKENKKSKKLFIGLGVLAIVIIVGVIAMQGSSLEKIVDTSDSIPISDTVQDVNSKCGPGTVFDESDNTCVLEETKKTEDVNSKCGPGTVFDEASNSCVVK